MEEAREYSQKPRLNLMREFLFVLFYHSKVLISVFLLIFICSALAAIFLPSKYRASAKFSMSIPEQLDPLQKESYYDYRNKAKRFLQDQREMILSNRVIANVVKELDPGIQQKDIPYAIEKIRSNIEVTPPKGETFEGSNVFYLSVIDNDPYKAVKKADALARAYLETYREISKSRAVYSYDFFKDQTDKLYQEMAFKEQKLREYETQNALMLIEILNLEPGKANMEVGPNALLTDLKRKYYVLQQELIGIRTAIEHLEKNKQARQIPAVIPEMEVHGRAITAFKNKVAQLQIQLNEMKSQFTPEFTPLKQAEIELNYNIKSLREELERTLQAHEITAQTMEARLQELDREIVALEESIRLTANERSTYESLKREYSLARDAYISARNQMEQARLAHSLNQEQQNLVLMDHPVVPQKPYQPNRPLLLLLGLFSAILLSIASVLTLDHFDHTIKKPEDIEDFTGLRVLGSIPRIG